jgi:hypothetical protein
MWREKKKITIWLFSNKLSGFPSVTWKRCRAWNRWWLAPWNIVLLKNNLHLFQGDRKIKRKPLRKNKTKILDLPTNTAQRKVSSTHEKTQVKTFTTALYKKKKLDSLGVTSASYIFFFLSVPPHSSNSSKSISSIWLWLSEMGDIRIDTGRHFVDAIQFYPEIVDIPVKLRMNARRRYWILMHLKWGN